MDKKIYGEKKEMKNLIFIGFGATLFLFSCASSTSKKEGNAPLNFIEGFLENGVSLTKVKRTFGEPHEIMDVKQIKETVYEYKNKSNDLTEWSFGASDQGEIVWFNYEPWFNPLLDRVETLPTTFKKYNCKKKQKPDTSVPHVTQNYTFFECAEGKIRAYYNIHGEISTIAVNR